jgi:hypothetical protein
VSYLKDKQKMLRDRLRHSTFAYLSEAAARDDARREFADFEIQILHSPHGANPGPKGYRMDFWIDEPGIVRSWERVLFEGLGKNA